MALKQQHITATTLTWKHLPVGCCKTLALWPYSRQILLYGRGQCQCFKLPMDIHIDTTSVFCFVSADEMEDSPH